MGHSNMVTVWTCRHVYAYSEYLGIKVKYQDSVQNVYHIKSAPLK